MPIEIDPASPALVSDASTASVTTASFTRTAGGLLVAMVMTASASDPTVSGGSLTWTRRVALAGTEVWTAPVTGSGAMTVTLGGLSDTGFGYGGAIKVVGVTGQDPVNPIGASGSNSATTNTLNVNGYTSTVEGSRGFLAASEGGGLGNPTAGSGNTGYPWTETLVFGFLDLSGIALLKTANTAASGISVTFNADAPSTSAADWTWAALEIVPEVSVRQRAFVSRAAVHRAASW